MVVQTAVSKAFHWAALWAHSKVVLWAAHWAAQTVAHLAAHLAVPSVDLTAVLTVGHWAPQLVDLMV